MRARLTGFGPQPLAAIAAALALPEPRGAIALGALEAKAM
jgi:ATP-dependent Lhr-like helicase